MSALHSLSHCYTLVGPAGAALAFLAFVALHLAIKNFIFLWLTGRDFHRAAKSIDSTAKNRDLIFKRFIKNPIIAIIDGVIKTHGEHSDDLKAEVAYLFHRHFSKAQRDITFLRVIAVIAPLLGLLGTLLGLLGVFKTLAYTSAVSTSTVLAAGIWEAILTTIMGLTLAIPSLIFYYILSLKLRAFHLVSIEFSYRFLECRPSCKNKNLCQSTAQKTATAEEVSAT